MTSRPTPTEKVGERREDQREREREGMSRGALLATKSTVLPTKITPGTRPKVANTDGMDKAPRAIDCRGERQTEVE